MAEDYYKTLVSPRMPRRLKFVPPITSWRRNIIPTKTRTIKPPRRNFSKSKRRSMSSAAPKSGNVRPLRSPSKTRAQADRNARTPGGGGLGGGFGGANAGLRISDFSQFFGERYGAQAERKPTRRFFSELFKHRRGAWRSRTAKARCRGLGAGKISRTKSRFPFATAAVGGEISF